MPLPPSAADWIRFKKLSANFNYGATVAANADLLKVKSPAGCTPCSSKAGTRRDQDQIVGTHSAVREASKWIDFKASQSADFVTVTQDPVTLGRRLEITELCNAGTKCGKIVPFRTGQGIFKSAIYQHSRIV
jgi:hypothetical protein